MTRATRCARVVLPLLLALAGRAIAQQPAERAELAAFRDTVATLADSSTLLRLEACDIDSARLRRNDALLHLRLGFVALRLADVTANASHYRDAEGEFQWATELQPRWPLAWNGLGQSELAEADHGLSFMRAVFTALGHDVYEQPARDIAHSAEVDSTFVRGVVGLSDDALRHGVHAWLMAALRALRDVAPFPAAHNPRMLLARGRIEREVGSVDSALVAFQALVNLRPADPAALLELARTRFETGRLDGVQPWYRGLLLADSIALPMYRFDLSLVMSDSALQVFDTTSGAARVADARRFWETRDPESLNSSAERLREHYRRIDVAHREYSMLPSGNRYDSLRTFAPTGAEFDDRGRVYVRHGVPDEKTSLSLAALPPNETWVYHRPSGDLIFNFAQPDSAQGYRAYESLLDIAGLGAAAQRTGQGNVQARLDSGAPLVTYGAAWSAQTVNELLESRQSISPVYRQLLTANPHDVTALERTERREGRRELALGLQTDDWKFGYELGLDADVDVLAVGGTAAAPQLQVAFAIPGSALYAPPSSGQVIYPVRTRVSVRTAAGDLVASVDSQRYFAAAHALSLGDHLLGRVAVPVPPGDYVVRVAVETPSRGTVVTPRTVHVAAMTAPAISVSDIALGARSVPLPWLVGRDTAWINPLRRFKASEPMQLYFQVGGVSAGLDFHVQLAILRSGHRDAQISFGYNTVATADPDGVRRTVDLGDLSPGTYTLRVTVSTARGGRAVRERSFTVTR